MIIKIAIPWVESDGSKGVRYVTASGELTAKETDAMSLEFRQPRHRDRVAITMAQHDFANGLAAFTDLEQGIFQVGSLLKQRASQALWPDGCPEDVSAQAAAIAVEAFIHAANAPEKAHLDRMRDMMQQIEFHAEWKVLIVNPPPGWESLGDRLSSGPHDEDIFQWAWVRYREGRIAEAAGKTRPSAS